MTAARTTTRFALLAVTLAVSVLLSRDIAAYTTTGEFWNRSSVDYRVNPANLDLPEIAVTAAVRAGADVWAQQSQANFSFAYAGASIQTSNTNDGVNLVMFRNASSGGAIATTYWWSNGTGIVDADIVFWDAAFRFFAGSTGCSGGFYIEDIAAHEFGHALGLGHSTAPNATMLPSTSSCNMRNRSLDADDIAGVQSLYPPRAAPPPTAPSGLRLIRP
jgi:matrix metalloproteinase-20 (enamelysin)